MKKLLIIAGVIFLILFVVVAMLARSSRTKQAATQQGVTFPIASTTGVSENSKPTLAIPMQGSGAITVKNFLTNGVTVADFENDGRYLVAGDLGYCLPGKQCTAGDERDFNIFYDSSSGVFTIALLREPLGEVRHETELYLEKTLGISAQQLCSLKYNIGTTYTVNEKYDGDSLGFSMCPGAVTLPL